MYKNITYASLVKLDHMATPNYKEVWEVFLMGRVAALHKIPVLLVKRMGSIDIIYRISYVGMIKIYHGILSSKE